MTTKDLLHSLLTAKSERDIVPILSSIGDSSEVGLDQEFGSLGLKWHAFGDKQSNLSSIGIASKPGRSLTERLTNAIDSILEERKPQGSTTIASPREAAMQWFGRPMSGPDTGLYQWIPLPQGMDRKYALVMLDSGSPAHATIDVIDYGIGIAANDFPNTILSLQGGNKMTKRYLIGSFGQGGASTLAFAPYTLIVSKSLSRPNEAAFTLIRVLQMSEEYKEDIYAYLSLNTPEGILTVPTAKDVSMLEPYHALAKVNLPGLTHGTLVRHINYELPRLDASFQASPGNLYHYLHDSLFDPLLPLRVIDLREPEKPNDQLVRGSRTRLMRLKARTRDSEEDTGSELKHYRQMEYIVPVGSELPCVGIEYWVVFNYKKSKTGQPTLRPASNELFVQPNKPVVGTLNGQNQGELTAAVCREAGLNLTSKHIVIHMDCTLVPSSIRKALFSTSREEFKDAEVLTGIKLELKRMLEEDERLKEIEKELTERITRREVDSANDEVKRTVSQLLREAGFKEREQGPSYEATTHGEPRKTHREKRPGYRVKEPLPTLPYPQVTYFKIVSPPLKLNVHKNDTEIILAETDADAEYFRQGRIALRAEPEALRVVSVSPLRGGRIRWRVEPLETAGVGTSGRIVAALTKPNGEQLTDGSLIFEIMEPIVKPAKKSKNTVPPFEIIPIDPDSDPEGWGRVWPALADESDRAALARVAYKAMEASGTVYIYYSTIFSPFADQLEKLKAEGAKAALFEQNYKVWIAYHAILQLQAGDELSHVNIASGEDEGIDINSVVDAIHERECSRTGEMIVRQAKQMAELTLKAVGQETTAVAGTLE